MPGRISIVGACGFISESYATAFLARASRAIAHRVRGGTAAWSAAGGHAFWDRALFARRFCSRRYPGALEHTEVSNLLPNKSDRTCHWPLVTGTMHTMKKFTSLAAILFAIAIASPLFAQTSAPSPAVATSPAGAVSAPGGPPNPQEMMKQMMEMSKLNENHKLLTDLDGNWNFAIKMWMNPDPNAPPQQSKGTAVRKSAMGGRYVIMDVTGKMQMPGEDGKMKEMQFNYTRAGKR